MKRFEQFMQGLNEADIRKNPAVSPEYLADLNRRAEANAQERSARLAQVGSGDRSEKIRTYNYKDNRTTDHRLGRNFSLEPVLNGQLHDLIGACIAADQSRQLEELAEQVAS